MLIPKIIHQIWSGIDEPLPAHFEKLGNTWKQNHPEWQYEFWNNRRMNDFVQVHYPQYWKAYCEFPYNIQRWDAIRYLILYKTGGLYADFDYESLKPIEKIVEKKTCCFPLEPSFGKLSFNNALMLAIPEHPFMKTIIEHVFSEKNLSTPPLPRGDCVMQTTGPCMLRDLYLQLSPVEKESVFLIPARYVTPLNWHQVQMYRKGATGRYELFLKEAYAIHYFYGTWWE